MADRTKRPRFANATAIVIVVVVVAALAVGMLVARRISADRACDEWHHALDRRTREVTGILGKETAQQFRLEAVQNGWIDLGTKRINRPSGCTP